MLVFGHFFALLVGVSIPIFQYFLSDLFDAFGPLMSKDEQMQKVELTVRILIGVGFGTWLLAYLYTSLLSSFALSLSRRVKKQYLTAILNQECAWFDQIKYTELSAKISRETEALQRGTGEKAGNVSVALGTIISGIVIAALRGWAISLCILGSAPLISLCAYTYAFAIGGNSAKGMLAYSQSAGYAE